MASVETLPTVTWFEVIPVWSLKALEGILLDAAEADELIAPLTVVVPTTAAIPATAMRIFHEAVRKVPP
jgi:hypothetical protein